MLARSRAGSAARPPGAPQDPKRRLGLVAVAILGALVAMATAATLIRFLVQPQTESVEVAQWTLMTALAAAVGCCGWASTALHQGPRSVDTSPLDAVGPRLREAQSHAVVGIDHRTADVVCSGAFPGEAIDQSAAQSAPELTEDGPVADAAVPLPSADRATERSGQAAAGALGAVANQVGRSRNARPRNPSS